MTSFKENLIRLILQHLREHPEGLGTRVLAKKTGAMLSLVSRTLEELSTRDNPLVEWKRLGGHGKLWKAK